MESQLIGNYLSTAYTFNIGVRKVTAYNCSAIPIRMNTLLKFGLRRPNSDEIEETALSVFSKNAGITIRYATNEDTAPTLAVAAAGSMTIGDHYYYIAYVYGSSETIVGTISAVGTTTSGNQTINLTNIPVGAIGCTARKIYKKTTVGGAWYLRGTISDNTTTIFSDTAADNTTTAAPTTSTAYDIKWGSTYGGVTTPVTVSGDDWWIEVSTTDPTKNYETGVQSIQDTNSIWQQNDSNIPLATTQALTATLAIQGSSFTGSTRNTQHFTFILATSTSTGFFLKFISKYVESGTDLTSLAAFSTFPMHPIKDIDGGIIYVLDTQMDASTTYKFDVWVVTANAVPEVEVYAKVGTLAGSPTLTTIVNNTYNTNNPPFNLSSIWSNGVQAIVDRLSGSLGTIDLAHRKLHYGKLFSASFYDDDIDTASPKYFRVTTNNVTTRAHFGMKISSNTAGVIELFRTPTLSAQGTSITYYNHDDNSAVTSAAITQTSGIAEDPTVTVEGTLIWTSRIGASDGGNNRSGAESGTGSERILAANTTYLVKYTPTADNAMASFELEWYDGGLDY